MTNSHKDSFFQLADWDLQTTGRLENLRQNLESTPASKKLIASMIRFSQMYQPLTRGLFSTNSWTDFDGLNQERKYKRLKIHLHKKDLLKSVDGAKGKSLILTTRAHKIFYQEYPLAKLRKHKWDGVWTIVTYDLPMNLKRERDLLRRKLKTLGFGTLQQSLLVCPLPLEEPIQELIEGEKLENHVVVLTAKRVLGLTNSQIAATAWNLKVLNDLYEKLLDVLPKVKKSGGKNLLSLWRTYFLAVNFEDPYLPRELLPEGWLGEKCQRAFSRLGLPGLLKIIFGA